MNRPNILQRLPLGMMTTLLVAGASLTATSAGFEHCFQINGEEHCFPIPVEQVKIRIKPDPDPDPPPIHDIRELMGLLRDVLGDTSDTWYMGSATGEQTFLLDLNAAEAIDLSGQAALPGF